MRELFKIHICEWSPLNKYKLRVNVLSLCKKRSINIWNVPMEWTKNKAHQINVIENISSICIQLLINETADDGSLEWLEFLKVRLPKSV